LQTNCTFQADPIHALFAKWKDQFPHAEAKLEQFALNWKRIALHNANSEATFRMEMNEFGSMTADEFAAVRLNGLLPDTHRKERAKDHVGCISHSVLSCYI
jgi:hypothetical protein